MIGRINMCVVVIIRPLRKGAHGLVFTTIWSSQSESRRFDFRTEWRIVYIVPRCANLFSWKWIPANCRGSSLFSPFVTFSLFCWVKDKKGYLSTRQEKVSYLLVVTEILKAISEIVVRTTKCILACERILCFICLSHWTEAMLGHRPEEFREREE